MVQLISTSDAGREIGGSKRGVKPSGVASPELDKDVLGRFACADIHDTNIEEEGDTSLGLTQI